MRNSAILGLLLPIALIAPFFAHAGDSFVAWNAAQTVNFGELIKGVTAPLSEFLRSLSQINQGTTTEGGRTAFERFKPQAIFERWDSRFREITGGVGIREAVNAVLGIFVWFLGWVIKFFTWLRSLIV